MLRDSKYQKLLAQIRRDLERARSHESVQQRLLQSYWSIGERLSGTKILQDPAYGDAVMKSLADETR